VVMPPLDAEFAPDRSQNVSWTHRCLSPITGRKDLIRLCACNRRKKFGEDGTSSAASAMQPVEVRNTASEALVSK